MILQSFKFHMEFEKEALRGTMFVQKVWVIYS